MIAGYGRNFGPRFGRQFGPQFGRGYGYGPRFDRGYGRPDAHFGHRGHWGHGHGYEQQVPSPERQALRATAAEVARLFAIAARSSAQNQEKQAQLRNFLERSGKELSDFIYGTTQSATTEGQSTTTEGSTNVEQA